MPLTTQQHSTSHSRNTWACPMRPTPISLISSIPPTRCLTLSSLGWEDTPQTSLATAGYSSCSRRLLRLDILSSVWASSTRLFLRWCLDESSLALARALQLPNRPSLSSTFKERNWPWPLGSTSGKNKRDCVFPFSFIPLG